MEWKDEIFYINQRYDVVRCKFIGHIPDCDYQALYYNSKEKITLVVNDAYQFPGSVYGMHNDDIYTDRKEAYEYSISKIKQWIDKLNYKIDVYEIRKLGLCKTTIDGVTTECEYEDYSWIL